MRLIICMVCALFFNSCASYYLIPKSDVRIEKDNAIIIVASYPETICNTTEGGYSSLLPLIGMGSKGRIRAGHIGLVLVKTNSDKFEYFDNGRYIAPLDYCRVRGANTDPELKIDIKPQWDNDTLVNLDTLLNWLYSNPSKTHGDGTLYAAICNNISYEKVNQYIDTMQEKGIMKYGPFQKDGINCTRFVTGTILNGTLDEITRKKAKKLHNLTPSVLDNIMLGNTYDYYFVVSDTGIIKSKSKLNKIQKNLLFDGGKGHTPYNPIGTSLPPLEKPTKSCQWLSGTGLGIWYDIKATELKNEFLVTTYNAKSEIVFSALFKSKKDFDISKRFNINYPSTFEYVTLETAEGDVILYNKYSN